MKFKTTLIAQFAFILVLAACGGGYVAENLNTGDTAGNDSANNGGYYPNLPAATAVPISAYAEEDRPDSQTPGRPDYNYGVSGYVDTREDHLSTFGIDVDTASYTLSQNHIQDGRMPPPDSVRVEEFVNYFDAGYPTPESVAFGIYADGAPSPFHSPEVVLLRFGIQGYQVPEELRKPLALTFVIDVSGSMGDPNKLDLVKQSLELLIERLQPEDTVSIVTFGSDARVIMPPTSGEHQSFILNRIRSLRPGGSTYAEAGLRQGYQLAIENFNSNAVNRVILSSDGVANVGQTQADELLKFIRGYANAGVTLTAMGFGMGTFNDPFMEELADNGDGSYAYIDDLDEARRLFVDELTSTLQVIARDAKIQVDFNPEVVSHFRLLGYENRAIADEDFRDDAVDAGEIGAGHSVTALYAVQLVPASEGRIATVQLRWEDPDTRRPVEINGNFNTWDLLDSFYDADPHYRLAVLAAQFAEILRQSPYSSEVPIESLLPFANVLTEDLPHDPHVWEFIDMLTRASRLD